MQDYQFIAIIGVNIGAFLTFLGIAISLHIENRRRIDAIGDRKVTRRRRK